MASRRMVPIRPAFLRLVRADVFVPVSVFVLGLLFTFFVTETLRAVVAARDVQRFKEVVGITHTTIEAKMEAVVAMLRAGVGLYNASEEVTRSEFGRFARELSLASVYRGVQGYGFAERVAPADMPAFLASRQAEGGLSSGFRVWPDQQTADDRYVIKYLEPEDERNTAALGFDMRSETTRRAAMERARDTGEPAATGIVRLVQEIAGDPQPGFLIYAPVYRGGNAPADVDGRRGLLAGFVYAPFRAGDLLESTLTAGLRSQVAFHVYQGAPVPQNLLYDSHRPGAEPASDPHDRTEARALTFAGTTWTIDYHSRPAFGATSTTDLVQAVPLAGGTLSALFAAIAFAQVRARRAALNEAKERRRAEAAVLEREKRLRRILDNIYALVVVLDPAGRALEVNRAPLESLDLSREDVIGRALWDLPWWKDAPETRRRLQAAVADAAAGRIVREDIEIPLEEGSVVLDMQIAPVKDDSGEVRFIVPFAVDITERKRSEQHRQTLLRELSHRVKNTLAVIQSLARQTGARARSVPEFQASLQGRITALAAANDLLIASGWRTAQLEGIVRLAVRAHMAREEDQLRLSVPDIMLPPELAQDLVLVLHELGTNAQKYGALSRERGEVAIEGSVGPDGLRLEWRESGGPPVTVPENTGFGSTLLDALIRGRHRGEVELSWRPEGLICTIKVPPEALVEPDPVAENRLVSGA
ncbi:CHASE domain-containing protein [Faunimonas sp. B44]|uniref:CHASE domain-containing protein n=1 Tax=Faunimonas sp. B44 TaxID=3461493 RepID=UPI00404418FB